jgi:hypothetical protein
VTQNLVQPSLSGGELAPALYGHVDLQRYGISLALCRNWIVNLGGGLKNRAGLRYTGTCASSTKRSRLVPFQFSSTQSYVLEFGDYTMKVYRAGAPINTTIAVTAAALGTGDGATTTFTIVEPTVPTVTAVYRNDWQGNQLLYPTPRYNGTYWSESPHNWAGTTGISYVTGAIAGPRPGSLADSISYNGSGTVNAFRVLFPNANVGAGPATASIWLKAGSATTVVLQDGLGNSVTCNLTTTWQRFSLSAVVASYYNLLLYQPLGVNTAFTIYADCYQVERGSVATAYLPATGPFGSSGAASVTDYTVSGYVVSFGEVPLSGAALTWTGTYPTTGGLVVTTPYAAADLPLLRWAQSNDVLTVVHPSYPPQQVKRLAESSWTMTPQVFNVGPFDSLNVDKTKTINFSGSDGAITITASSPIFTADKVGLLFYVQQILNPTPWSQAQVIGSAGLIRRSDGKNYRALNSGTTGTVQPLQTDGKWDDGGVSWQFMDQGFGCARISTVSGDAFSAQAVVTSHIPDNCVVTAGSTLTISAVSQFLLSNQAAFNVTAHGFSIGTTVSWVIVFKDNNGVNQTSTGSAVISQIIDANNFLVPNLFTDLFPNAQYVLGVGLVIVSATLNNYVQASYRWAFGAWNNSNGYPQSVTYHQQRLTFAGSPKYPQTVWMSRTNAFGDFSQSSPLVDDDSLTFSFASGRQDPIQGMMPLGQLLAFTSNNAWVVGNSAQNALTPGNISARVQGFNGASALPILPVDSAVLFVQSKGTIVRGMGYSYQYAYDNYAPSTNLSIHAEHLFNGFQIQEWAFQQVPFSCVWCVRSDGELLGFTYNQEQQVTAWHRHDTQNGLFESACVISEGGEDVLYVIVNRTINGAPARYVERMDTRTIASNLDGFFVDCGLSFDGRNTTAQTVTLTGGTAWNQTEHITINSSAQLFNSPKALVGDQIGFILADGSYLRLTIDTITSNTQATGIPSKLVPVAYRSGARADWFWATANYSGLTQLANQPVVALADGNAMISQGLTVSSGGAVTLPRPAFRVHIGLQIIADIQTLGVAFGPPDQGIERVKAINAVRLMVNTSTALFAGRDPSHLFQQKFRSFEAYDSSDAMTTGIEPITITTSWGTDGTIFIRNVNPLQANISAIVPEVSIGGSSG